MNSKNRAVRIAINFDLSTKALEEIFGTGNTSKPYSDIKRFMESNGFMHRQYSGYVSVEPKTESDIALLAMKMSKELPWFGRAVEEKEIDVTEIGKVYSIKDYYINPDKDIQKQDLGDKIMENQNKGQDFLFMSSNGQKALEEAHFNKAKSQILEAMDMQKLAKIDSSLRNSGVSLASDKPNFGDTKDYLMSMPSDKFMTLLVQNKAFDTKAFNNDELLRIDEFLKIQRNMAIELLASKDSVEERKKAIEFLKQNSENQFILKGLDNPELKPNQIKELADADVFLEAKNRYIADLAIKDEKAIKEAAKKHTDKTDSMAERTLNWLKDTTSQMALDGVKDMIRSIIEIIKFITDPKQSISDLMQNGVEQVKNIFGAGVNVAQDKSLVDKIKAHEGFSEKIYICPTGHPTVGYGFKVSSLTSDELALNNGQAEPMSREVADKILDLKLSKLESQVYEKYPFIKDKPESVQKVYMDMAYNMGMAGFGKFKNFHEHIKNDRFGEASENIRDSLYAKQVGNRAEQNAKIIAHAGDQNQDSGMKI